MKLSDEVMKNDPDGNPRYVGPDPHNYITFNNELWRIIGVFNGQAKIIRNEPYSTSLSWDTNSSDWSKASLQQELNNTYLNQIDIASQLLINTLHTWSLGGWGTYNITRSEIYNYERGNIVYNDNQATWTGAIGLMYPSDYGYATNSQSDICDTTIINNLANESASSECRDKNWLHNKLYNQWTMTPTSENSIFGITSYGAIYRVYVYGTSLSSSPVLYLKPEIKIIDGKGTQENPYQISI